jgi:hypothetical protein
VARGGITGKMVGQSLLAKMKTLTTSQHDFVRLEKPLTFKVWAKEIQIT